MLLTIKGNIFKKYYSRKINKNLMTETTGDLLILLQKHTHIQQTVSAAAQALRCGDAVKFAKYIPPAEVEQLYKDLNTILSPNK